MKLSRIGTLLLSTIFFTNLAIAGGGGGAKSWQAYSCMTKDEKTKVEVYQSEIWYKSGASVFVKDDKANWSEKSSLAVNSYHEGNLEDANSSIVFKNETGPILEITVPKEDINGILVAEGILDKQELTCLGPGFSDLARIRPGYCTQIWKSWNEEEVKQELKWNVEFNANSQLQYSVEYNSQKFACNMIDLDPKTVRTIHGYKVVDTFKCGDSITIATPKRNDFDVLFPRIESKGDNEVSLTSLFRCKATEPQKQTRGWWPFTK